MNILTWALLGLVAGILAKLFMPGRDGGGIVMTILLGVAGAVVGGRIGLYFGWGGVQGLDIQSIALAIGGAMTLLLGYRVLTGRV